MTFPELYIAIEERRELAQHASQTVQQSEARLDVLEDEIHEMTTHLEPRYEVFDAERAAHGKIRALEEIQYWQEEALIEFKHTEELASHQFHEVQHELEYKLIKLWETHAQIEIKTHQIEDNIHNFEELLDDQKFSLSMAFSDFADQSLSIQHEIERKSFETDDILSSFADTLSNQTFEDLDHSFGEFKSTASNISNSALPGTVDQFIKELDSNFDFLIQSATDQSHVLTDSVEMFAQETSHFVERAAMGELERTMDRFTKEALPQMEDTLRQMLAVMQHGSHIATAISHWLPALKQIRETVGHVQMSAEGM